MREAEFRSWLEVGGVDAESSRNSRVYAIKTIERKLGELGTSCADLSQAWELDRFEQLRQRIREIREDARDGGNNYRILMPDAENPRNRLSNWNNWLGQYGRFLSGEPHRGARDADRIRQYVLEHYIEPAREADQDSVDVLVRDVNKALGLNQAWPNICQALEGGKFQEHAQIGPPERIGAEMSSATIFRFNLSEEETVGNVGGVADQQSITGNSEQSAMNKPTNLILYGPPGTGKTYAAAAEAVRLCGEPVPDDRNELMAAYRRLSEARRIDFITFHQSVAYEEFVEGLRPTQTNAKGSAGFELKPKPGVFRNIVERAQSSARPGNGYFDISDREVFKMSIGRVANPDDAHLFEEAIDGGYTLLGWADIDWSDDRFADREAIIEAVRGHEIMEGGEPNASTGAVQMPFMFRNSVKPGDVLVVSKGNNLFRAIGEVTGDYQFVPREGGGYCHRRAVRWLWVDRTGVPVGEIYPYNFSQKSVYLLKDSVLNKQALQHYVDSQQDAGSSSPEPFVLVIDEINRANISKVFGELITLLEPDKRLGQPNELKVRLPYSEEEFGIPSNLHIVGTMNTADRSIALLDTALRRRFEFRELMPDASLLSTVDGVGLSLTESQSRNM